MWWAACPVIWLGCTCNQADDMRLVRANEQVGGGPARNVQSAHIEVVGELDTGIQLAVERRGCRRVARRLNQAASLKCQQVLPRRADRCELPEVTPRPGEVTNAAPHRSVAHERLPDTAALQISGARAAVCASTVSKITTDRVSAASRPAQNEASEPRRRRRVYVATGSRVLALRDQTLLRRRPFAVRGG